MESEMESEMKHIDPRLLRAGPSRKADEHGQNNGALESAQATQPNQPGEGFLSEGLVDFNNPMGGDLTPFNATTAQWDQKMSQQPPQNVSFGTPFGQMPTMNQNAFSNQSFASTYPLGQQLPYQMPTQMDNTAPSGGLNYSTGDMGQGFDPSSQLAYGGTQSYTSADNLGFGTSGMGLDSETFSFQQPAQGGGGSTGNDLVIRRYGPGLDAELEGANIPSKNDLVQRQFKSIYQLLDKADGGDDAKRFALSVIQFVRNYRRGALGMLPPLSDMEPCSAGQLHLAKHVHRFHEWMILADQLGTLDQQISELERFRAFYHFPGMTNDDWSQPISNAAIPFPSESGLPSAGYGGFVTGENSNRASASGNMISEQDPLPIERTGTYRGYANSQESADRLTERYLKQNNKPGGSLTGFPKDDAGKCRLVRQAFQAMMQLDGSREASENKKSTAFNRIKDRFRLDIEVELMAWKLLRACEEAQKGICKIPAWFSDGRLSHYAEYRTFRERWAAVIQELKVSKKLVNALFDVEFVQRTAWNVKGEVNRKESNHTGNVRKSEFLRDKTKAATAQESEVDEEERPAKRHRT